MHLSISRGFGLLLGGAALTGCSLIYDLSPDQCGSTADCDSFGANYICEAGMCKLIVPPAECEESSDGLEADATTPRACIEQVPGSKSTRHCVNLTTPECPLILPISANPEGEAWRGYLSTPNSIVIGAYGFL